MTVRLLLAVLAAVLAGASPAAAQDFPPFTGLVTDAAHVLPADRAQALQAKLESLQQQTGRQLVVATVPSLGGDDIQDYGYKLGRAWGVGLKGADNGAILLIAPADRKVGIEVGTGLEPVLTDAYSSVVINGRILPAFKAGDLPGGIAAGTDALIDVLSQPDDQSRAKQQAAIAAWNKAHAGSGESDSLWPLLLWLGIMALVVVPMVLRRRHGGWGGYGRSYGGSDWPIWLWAASELGERHRGSWGAGGWDGGGDGAGGGWTGGGFTGGGGGSFGGGGASGGW